MILPWMHDEFSQIPSLSLYPTPCPCPLASTARVCSTATWQMAEWAPAGAGHACSSCWVLNCGGQGRKPGSRSLSEGASLLKNWRNSGEPAGERDCSKSLHRLEGGANRVWSAPGFQARKGVASEGVWLSGWLTYRKSLSFKNLHHEVWKTDKVKSAGPISLLNAPGFSYLIWKHQHVNAAFSESQSPSVNTRSPDAN